MYEEDDETTKTGLTGRQCVIEKCVQVFILFQQICDTVPLNSNANQLVIFFLNE